jgi:hypothetical protein
MNHLLHHTRIDRGGRQIVKVNRFLHTAIAP